MFWLAENVYTLEVYPLILIDAEYYLFCLSPPHNIMDTTTKCAAKVSILPRQCFRRKNNISLVRALLLRPIMADFAVSYGFFYRFNCFNVLLLFNWCWCIFSRVFSYVHLKTIFTDYFDRAEVFSDRYFCRFFPSYYPVFVSFTNFIETLLMLPH